MCWFDVVDRSGSTQLADNVSDHRPVCRRRSPVYRRGNHDRRDRAPRDHGGALQHQVRHVATLPRPRVRSTRGPGHRHSAPGPLLAALFNARVAPKSCRRTQEVTWTMMIISPPSAVVKTSFIHSRTKCAFIVCWRTVVEWPTAITAAPCLACSTLFVLLLHRRTTDCSIYSLLINRPNDCFTDYVLITSFLRSYCAGFSVCFGSWHYH